MAAPSLRTPIKSGLEQVKRRKQVSGICLNRGIKINGEILDSAKTKIGQVKVIGPSYLVVGVRLRFIRWAYWIRYLDCGYISRIEDGHVKISVIGSEVLSKTPPTGSEIEMASESGRLVRRATFNKGRNCGMNGSGAQLDIKIGDKVFDSSSKIVATVRGIERDDPDRPDYLVVSVGSFFLRTRFIGMEYVSSSAGGCVNLRTSGGVAFSKTKPRKRTIEQLLKSESIPVGTRIHGSDGEFVSRADALRPGEIVFYSGGAVWTARAGQIESYDPVERRLNLSRPSTDFLPERS